MGICYAAGLTVWLFVAGVCGCCFCFSCWFCLLGCFLFGFCGLVFARCFGLTGFDNCLLFSWLILCCWICGGDSAFGLCSCGFALLIVLGCLFACIDCLVLICVLFGVWICCLCV